MLYTIFRRTLLFAVSCLLASWLHTRFDPAVILRERLQSNPLFTFLKFALEKAIPVSTNKLTLTAPQTHIKTIKHLIKYSQQRQANFNNSSFYHLYP